MKLYFFAFADINTDAQEASFSFVNYSPSIKKNCPYTAVFHQGAYFSAAKSLFKHFIQYSASRFFVFLIIIKTLYTMQLENFFASVSRLQLKNFIPPYELHAFVK